MKAIKIKTVNPWTVQHDEQCYELYMQFLQWQRDGEKYQKAKHVRALAEKQGRSHGSIEAKLMNVSAIRRDLLASDWIDGYKPLNRYAHQLAKTICSIEGFDYE